MSGVYLRGGWRSFMGMYMIHFLLILVCENQLIVAYKIGLYHNPLKNKDLGV